MISYGNLDDPKTDSMENNETVWLTQKLMAELSQTTKQNISLQLKNVFAEGELNEIQLSRIS